MRIRVIDVLELFAGGLSADEILEEMPDLEREDLQASLIYAARKFNHKYVMREGSIVNFRFNVLIFFL